MLGTVQNAGTDIMIISDLNAMEARVDVGEMDVVGIKPGQKARLEVDAFKDRKFSGTVTDVASSSKDNNLASAYSSSSSQSQEATKFQVRIRLNDKEDFRPGMSVSADIETEYRTNVLTVPLASVTTRPPKKTDPPKTGGTNTATIKSGTNATASSNMATNSGPPDKKSSKMLDVVFAVNGNHVNAVPVKIGICDDNYWEITDGLTNGQEIVSGGYRAISRDLDDGKKIKKGTPDTGRKRRRRNPKKPKSENRTGRFGSAGLRHSHSSFGFPHEPDSPPECFAALPDGRGNRPRAARCVAGNPARRIRRHHGAVRFRQIHDDEPHRLSRYRHVRPL